MKKLLVTLAIVGLLPYFAYSYMIGTDNNELSTNTKVMGYPCIGINEATGKMQYFLTASTSEISPQEQGGVLKVMLMGMYNNIITTIAVNATGNITMSDTDNQINTSSIDNRFKNIITTGSNIVDGNNTDYLRALSLPYQVTNSTYYAISVSSEQNFKLTDLDGLEPRNRAEIKLVNAGSGTVYYLTNSANITTLGQPLKNTMLEPVVLTKEVACDIWLRAPAGVGPVDIRVVIYYKDAA